MTLSLEMVCGLEEEGVTKMKVFKDLEMLVLRCDFQLYF